eukprot:scaffold2188_cov388-Prasinococcus_capsulatus_cf.AAC.1
MRCVWGRFVHAAALAQHLAGARVPRGSVADWGSTRATSRRARLSHRRMRAHGAGIRRTMLLPPPAGRSARESAPSLASPPSAPAAGSRARPGTGGARGCRRRAAASTRRCTACSTTGHSPTARTGTGSGSPECSAAPAPRRGCAPAAPSPPEKRTPATHRAARALSDARSPSRAPPTPSPLRSPAAWRPDAPATDAAGSCRRPRTTSASRGAGGTG